jgi:hypothetical protein
LKHLSSYPMEKHAKIILACMVLHNFIRDSHVNDDLFDMCDEDEDFAPSHEYATSSHSQLYGQEESDMNIVHDSITNGLMKMYQLVTDICYVYHNYIRMIFMNMGQFINDHVLINYLKKISYTTSL